MEVKRDIERWKNLTDKITSNWIKDYFELEEDDYIEADWVANEVGGIFNFADYYFDFNTILKCYELGITKEQLFEWYDYTLENEFVNISLARFILSPEERDKQDKENLKKRKEDLEYAEKEFKKALEKWKK